MQRRRRKLTKASNLDNQGLARTLGNLRLKTDFDRYGAFSRWEEIVGSEVATVTKPIRIASKKILVVQVTDSAWVQELAMRKQELLAKLQTSALGCYIDDIHFITGNPRNLRT